jgi:ribonuclease R
MDIRAKIQRLMSAPDYRPLRRAELAKKLRLADAERPAFRRALAEMVRDGSIVRVRKNRFVLPQEADLVVGRIEFNERGFAFVRPENNEQPDVYVAEQDTGVAMHRDKVVVRLNKGPREPQFADKPSGRVIRILERANETIVGTLQQTKHFQYVVPDEPRILHDIYVKPSPKARVGDKVIVKLDEWKSRHVNPEGVIVENLGKSDAPGVDIVAIIRKYHLPTAFPASVLHEAEQIPEKIPEHEYKNRRDLRKKFIVTIDPDDAKDFDDAVNVDELPDGGWQLGVHIADVSFYVRPNSALDREARARANSVYLVDRVIPMLPEKLSNGVCSLRPHEDRLTKSVFITFSSKLAVKKVEFAETIIHSRHRLTYREAFRRLQMPENGDELTRELHKMWRLASKIRQKRFAHGSLDLNFPEVKVRVDARGKPVSIEKIEYDISHQLIEEFMLAANEAVAKQLFDRQIPTVYRVHEDPDEEKLLEFREYARSFGYKVGDVTDRHELQKLLEAVHGKPEEYAVNLALLRSLKRARYATMCIGHYGLAKRFYLHFTSPIRRYADLVAHRGLAGLLRQKPPSDDTKSLGHIAENASLQERIADEAETESVELKRIEYFQQQLLSGKLDAMPAVICDVKNFGLFVELPDSLAQGLVHISRLDDDFYHYDETRRRLVGKRTKKVLQIGDKVLVTVDRVDVFKRQIDFRIVES